MQETLYTGRSTKVCKTRVPQAQVSRGLLMRLALPEELEARAEGEDIRDTVFTVPLLRDCKNTCPVSKCCTSNQLVSRQ